MARHVLSGHTRGDAAIVWRHATEIVAPHIPGLFIQNLVHFSDQIMRFCDLFCLRAIARPHYTSVAVSQPPTAPAGPTTLPAPSAQDRDGQRCASTKLAVTAFRRRMLFSL